MVGIKFINAMIAARPYGRFNRSNPFYFDPREPIRFAGVRHCSPWFAEDYRLGLVGGE